MEQQYEENQEQQSIPEQLEQTNPTQNEEIREEVDSPQQDQIPDPYKSQQPSTSYMSYEEWVAAGKDPKRWRDPRTYEDIGKFMNEIKTLRATNYALANMFVNVRAKERYKAKVEIEQQYRDAIDIGDTVEALSLQNRLQDIQQEEQQDQQIINKTQESAANEVRSFVERNPQWFNPYMPLDRQEKYWEAKHHEASIRQRYMSEGKDPEAYPSEILEEIESVMKNNMAYSQPRKNPISPPSNGGMRVPNNVGMGVNEKVKFDKLDEKNKTEFHQIKTIMKQSGVDYTVSDYLSQLEDYGYGE